ncbi:Protein of unknown function DUF4281 [Macleaya cordata]|uniref:Uncharacterized protein n=1 Tax=Macleaya cordata TaxID=56857 RepID=A0A200Q3D7_MACCD|nr:Protein of unknown function DUF4281 [Macleaya cordata]
MACPSYSQISLKVDRLWRPMQPHYTNVVERRIISGVGATNAEIFGRRVARIRTKLSNKWSFVGGSRVVIISEVARYVPSGKCCAVSSSWFTSYQIASSVFTLGTVAVLPFYTLMVLAPRAELTKRSMESSIPYVILGLLYAYLLYLSWTPDTIRMMFASQYWLPELPGIAKMFSSEITLASAWIHLLAIDLYAARQVFLDGLENDIETRHSVSLCLLFCPIGILTHVITTVLNQKAGNTKQSM